MITIAIGANLDIQNTSSKYETCLKALEILQENFDCKIIKTSDWYETTAWPNPSDPPYINGAAIVEPAVKDAAEFLLQLHEIEAQLGRVRHKRWGARTIDLDILTWNDMQTENKDTLKSLAIPHPRLHERYFVLVPLAQIAPQMIIPSLKKTTQYCLNKLNYDKKDIRLFKKAKPF